MNKLLIIVDMINGYVSDGNIADYRIRRIVPNVEILIRQAIYGNDKIVVFVDEHEKNDKQFRFLPPHCIKGTRECELVKELQEYVDNFIIIKKDMTNGYNTKEFKQILGKNYFSEIKICGCFSDRGVSLLTKSILKFNSAVQPSCKVKVISDAIDTYNSEDHVANFVNRKVLDKLRYEGAIITDHENNQQDELGR